MKNFNNLQKSKIVIGKKFPGWFGHKTSDPISFFKLVMKNQPIWFEKNEINGSDLIRPDHQQSGEVSKG